MKLPLFIFLIIFNLLSVNLAVAVDMHSENQDKSYQVHSHDEGETANHDKEPCCDHCCHSSTHLTGIILSSISMPVTDIDNIYIASSIQFYSLAQDPPDHPPQI